MTDESLMVLVKNDDLEKASILYQRYKKKLYHFYLFRNCNDQEASEDCVQQVFYRMIKYRKSYIEGNNFGIWIYKIAQNVLYQDLKNQAKMNSIQNGFRINEMYTAEPDEYSTIRQAIQLLPEPYREVLIMSKFMELKYEEIAQISNCSVGVIKTRVFRAISQLKEKYNSIA
ncbi:RNA polymerase sigma factor RpoE [Mucilaginibacter dorajii]|uniref:RNA polymerase sigma factor RpoE n=2 Tax=Mucilaginibacter dorajii TaxID=692994 RepID=A0ABP7QZ84_9SPHI